MWLANNHGMWSSYHGPIFPNAKARRILSDDRFHFLDTVKAFWPHATLWRLLHLISELELLQQVPGGHLTSGGPHS
jgi:hypothetical protein